MMEMSGPSTLKRILCCVESHRERFLWLSKNQESFLAEICHLTGPPGTDRGVFLLLAEMHVCLFPGSGNTILFTSMVHTTTEGYYFVYWSSKKLTSTVWLTKRSSGLLLQAWKYAMFRSMYSPSSLIKLHMELQNSRIAWIGTDL